MHGLTVFCVALCVGLAAAGAISSPTFNYGQSRIVGGQNANPGQFPYIASLRRVATGGHFCGSSIIRPSWVMSAAHCTEDFAPAGIRVVVGSIFLNNEGIHHTVSRIINHPEYNRARLTNDISLVEVTNAFVYTATVQPIGISAVQTGAVPATVSGWGLTQHQGSLPTVLQTLATNTLTNEECRSRHNVINRQFVHDNVICTLNPAGQGMCNGDSGGSLVVGNFVVGVPSWVIPCGMGFPDAYARVSSHTGWIVGHVGQ